MNLGAQHHVFYGICDVEYKLTTFTTDEAGNLRRLTPKEWQEKRQKLKEDIMKKLDSLENEFLPQVRIVTPMVTILADQDFYSFEGDGGWDWVWQYSQF